MVKNTTLREDKVLNELKKAFPTYSFGNYVDMARLIQPKDFQYKNRSKLETQFTKDILQSIYDVTLLMQYLNKRNKSKILTSPEFNHFMIRIMDFSKFGNVDEDYLASFYPNMIKHGVKGITNNMPHEFTALIEEHLKPLILLLNSITAYAKLHDKKGGSAYSPSFEDFHSDTL